MLMMRMGCRRKRLLKGILVEVNDYKRIKGVGDDNGNRIRRE